MRTVVCPVYGSPEVLRVEERPSPTPGPGQALIRVAAASVNYPDVLLVADKYQISVPTPFVPGSEFAGVVTEITSPTTAFGVGDRVSGTGLFGAFAEEIVVDIARLSAVPDGVDLRTAAAFGVAHRTAYHALRSVAEVDADEEVIVLGAGGGVGLAAVALATRLGASVTAVASSADKLAAATAHGAAHTIDHRAGELRSALRSTLPEGAHAVLDPVGGALSEPALRSLRRGGRFVTIGYASGEIPCIPLNLVLIKGIHVLGFQFQDLPSHQVRRNDAELVELLTQAKVTPHIDAVYTLDNAAAALRRVADGKAVGKVLLDLTDPP
ncbi:NADPH:quinone oxidoreductase family protein [Nocardia callitridis]|uniref:NADPH:quinone oxidoreductase family protein n=1 Tax=Nocardia callitridis TaxID=648753 RepID=A0ABP9KAB8_9NOCA